MLLDLSGDGYSLLCSKKQPPRHNLNTPTYLDPLSILDPPDLYGSTWTLPIPGSLPLVSGSPAVSGSSSVYESLSHRDSPRYLDPPQISDPPLFYPLKAVQ